MILVRDISQNNCVIKECKTDAEAKEYIKKLKSGEINLLGVFQDDFFRIEHLGG